MQGVGAGIAAWELTRQWQAMHDTAPRPDYASRTSGQLALRPGTREAVSQAVRPSESKAQGEIFPAPLVPAILMQMTEFSRATCADRLTHDRPLTPYFRRSRR